jgi:uncharacterized protein (DUF302 family)
MPDIPDSGIVRVPSHFTVEQTVQRIEQALASRNIKLFATIDHSGEAEKAGLQMRPTKLLIFGNPKAGTPLMIAAPSSALDLPLKLLVAQDAEGRVWISYSSAEFLQKRHSLPQYLMQNVAVMEALAATAAG